MLYFFYKLKSLVLHFTHIKLKNLLREGELREKIYFLEKIIDKTSEMEDLQKLMLQKEMLLIELNSIERKIQLLSVFNTPKQSTMVIDEPESQGSKSSTIPEQTATGKEKSNPFMDVACPKSKLEIVDLSTTSPVQTETGKDKSNPLMADALPKSILAEMPQKISLRPSWQDVLQNKSETKTKERFYVIYNGPNQGIYTNWGIVSKLTVNNTVSLKKFKSFKEANFSASEYMKVHGGDIKIKEVILTPNLAIRKKPIVKKQTSQDREVKENIVKDQTLTKNDFISLWLKARNSGEIDYIHENYFTIDKKLKSLYCFCEEADGKMVHLAFLAGLIKNIYPSNNLLEIKFFDEGIKKAIKNFRTKIAKSADARIYICITSSIPDWENEVFFKPYYFIEIGLVNKNKDFPEIKEIHEDQDPKDELLQKIRVDSLRLFIEKINSIDKQSNIKINYFDQNIIITSWCKNQISEEDLGIVEEFQRSFNDNSIMVGPTTKKSICRQMKKIFENHTCDFCNKEDKCDAKSGSTEDKEDSF